MKLFSLRLTTLKNKLYAIVFASFVVRVVAFFALPNTASNLGPDEGTYAKLTVWISNGNLAHQFESDTLYVRSRSIILPASLFYKVGFSPIDSVRLVASLYGLLLLFLIAKTILASIEMSKLYSLNQNKTLVLFSIFAFLPSHLLWSLLGMREAALEFWVLVTFALVFYLFEVKKNLSVMGVSGITVAIPIAFSSRPQTGLVLGATLLIYMLFRIKTVIARVLIPFCIIGILLGVALSNPKLISSNIKFVAQIVNETPIPSKSQSIESGPVESNSPHPTTKSEFNASLQCKSDGQILNSEGKEFKCYLLNEKNTGIPFTNFRENLLEETDQITVQHKLNQLGATSAIKTLSCPNTGTARLDRYFCIAYRAPFTTYTFLFRPLLGADVTSNSSLFAAVENVFWLGAALFIVVMFIRNRRLAFFGALAPSLLFFSIYSVAAGSYEGNMGTAFRHKSLILWVVILLLASTIVATQQRKAEQQANSGSSQE